MWYDKTREVFQSMFNGVGLSYSSAQVEQVLQLLIHYECRDAITQGVMDITKPVLVAGITEQAHQFLAFTAYLQSAFMRPLKLERTDVIDPKSLNLAALKQCVKVLGMLDEIKPKSKEYPRVIASGGFQFRLEGRLQYFIKLIKSGEITGVKHLLVSVGDRELADFESAKQQGAKTEADMGKVVVKELTEKHPEIFKVISVDFHNALRKPDDIRARTDDAAEQTAEMYVQETAVLLITDQPFCQYQHETFQIPFSPTPVETVGEAASADYNGWNFCDSFSRYMYSSARRYLMVDCKFDAKKAGDSINEYKKHYTCDSSLYFEGTVRSELLVAKVEDLSLRK